MSARGGLRLTNGRSRWRGIGVERNVANGDDVELLDAARRSHADGIAFARLEKCARHRRNPAYVAAPGVDLVDAHDADRALVAREVPHGDRCPEKHARFGVIVARHGGIDNFGVVEATNQEADAPIDLTQSLLAVDVIAVLGSIAVA